MNAEASALTARRTPLYEDHRQLGAKFTEFSGWTMPVLYSGIIDEHHNVRNLAGLFDVSHMGEIRVSGEHALPFLQHLTTNDVSRLKVGEAQYSLLLNPDGGVIDDIIIYRLAANDYLLCVNAGNAEKDWNWIQRSNTFGAKLENLSDSYGQLALQGPRAREILSRYLEQPAEEYSVENFRPFTFRIIRHKVRDFGIAEMIVACTGYTGEDGFEIFCPAGATSGLWQELLEVGAASGLKSIGLGARDTLRLEVCYPLHGHELRDDLNALWSAVGWVVKYDKGDFIGRDALVKEKERGLSKKLVGLEVLDRGIVRDGAKLFRTSDGETPDGEVGWVSSGTKTPTVDKAVALAFVPPELSALGTQLLAEVRGKFLKVAVVSRPFYQRNTKS